jgi:hypothetical protein
LLFSGEKNQACVFEQRSTHTLTGAFNTGDNEFSFDFNRPTLYSNGNGMRPRVIESTKYTPLIGMIMRSFPHEHPRGFTAMANVNSAMFSLATALLQLQLLAPRMMRLL